MKKSARALASILISALCLYFTTRNVRWSELKIILSQAKLYPILLAVLISTLSFWGRALRWQMILRPFQRIPIISLLRWQIGGLLINNLLPLRLGELARAYWAGHKSSISKSSVLATIFLERILDIGLLALLAIFIFAILGKGGPFFAPFNLLIFSCILLAILILARIYLNRFSGIPLGQKLRNFLPQKFSVFFEKFLIGFKIIQDKKELLKLMGQSLFVWSVDIATITAMSYSLGINLNWFQAGFVMVGLVLGVMIPAAPGAAGTYEAGGVIALSLLGSNKTLALSLILLVHAVQYFFVLCLGVPILAAEGFNPKKFLQNDPKDT